MLDSEDGLESFALPPPTSVATNGSHERSARKPRPDSGPPHGKQITCPNETHTRMAAREPHLTNVRLELPALSGVSRFRSVRILRDVRDVCSIPLSRQDGFLERIQSMRYPLYQWAGRLY
jgi:hypothetical protein